MAVIRLQTIPADSVPRKSSTLREAATMACSLAVTQCGMHNEDLAGKVVGIVGKTRFGEKYPELWLANDGIVRPTQFGSAILNSVIGHVAIQLHLNGPQILLTRGDACFVASLQIEWGRAEMMFVVDYVEDDVVAAVMVRA